VVVPITLYPSSLSLLYIKFPIDPPEPNINAVLLIAMYTQKTGNIF
jgi:hypothetical protein